MLCVANSVRGNESQCVAEFAETCRVWVISRAENLSIRVVKSVLEAVLPYVMSRIADDVGCLGF